MDVGQTSERVHAGLQSISERLERRRGRPTKGAAAGLSNGILEIAFHQFMSVGYAATSMDSVAAEARISKRTLYDRFPSKVQLFAAALRQQTTLDFQDFRRFETEDGPLDGILLKMAEWLLGHLLDPRTIALHRLVASEGPRMQEVAEYSEEQMIQPMISVLTRVFERALERGDVIDLPSGFLAHQFFVAVCGDEVRKRLFGVGWIDEIEAIQERTRNVVTLFVAGARPRPVVGAD